MKTSKFLIAENPLVDDRRVFVIHTREPVVLAEVFHFDMDQEASWLECKRRFTVGASVDYPNELICIGAVYISPDAEAGDLPGLMSRMGDWYFSYLKWEDGHE